MLEKLKLPFSSGKHTVANPQLATTRNERNCSRRYGGIINVQHAGSGQRKHTKPRNYNV